MLYRPERGLRHLREFTSLENFAQQESRDQSLQMVSLAANHDLTDYFYEFTFVVDHPRGPHLLITTESREQFLKKGSEADAENELLRITALIKDVTSGAYWIHPFYGAVYGTAHSPITNFNSTGPQENLGTLLYFSDNGQQPFDKQAEVTARFLGAIQVGLPEMWASLENQVTANKANPNGADRNIALVNGLAEQWDEQNRIFNLSETIVNPAIKITHKSVVNLAEHLKRNGFSNLVIDGVHYR